MTQSERTAYYNAFAVGMTIGINARKEPFRILSTVKHTGLVTGDTPVIESSVPVSIAESVSVTTGDTPGVHLGVPVSFGASIFLEEI